MSVTTTVQVPPAPAGYQACTTNGSGPSTPPARAAGLAPGTSWNHSHLVALDSAGHNGGRPTVCGLARFDRHHPVTHEVLEHAGLPGWGMGGGLSGPEVVQLVCAACWDGAGAREPAGTVRA